jgi:hypothetical protein
MKTNFEITPENAAIIASIDGYKNGLEYGNDALQIATMWAGPALTAYKLGVRVAIEELKNEDN